MSARKYHPVLLAAALAAAACGGGHRKAAPAPPTLAPSTSTSSTVATTTTTAIPTWPLTGLPVTDFRRAILPVLVVKIDNAPRARPQAGLAEADVIVEEQVEGGLTRFAALFESRDAPLVGPVRSARSTDIALVEELNHPLFAYSGANARFLQLVHAAPLHDVGVDADPAAYDRDVRRPAPYNLFTSTGALFALAPRGSGRPAPLWSFRAAGQPAEGAGARSVNHVLLHFPGAFPPTVGYDWDPRSGTWLRSQDGAPHLDAAGHRLAPVNVIIQFIAYTPTGLVDQAGTPVYEGQLVGSGVAWIFTGGAVIPGRWSRPAASSVTAYTDAAGQPVPLAPGQTWIELPAAGTPVAVG